MIKYGDMNITKLYRLSKINYIKLKNELRILQDMNIIEILGDNKKIIRVNYSNPKVIILINLLEELNKDD